MDKPQLRQKLKKILAELTEEQLASIVSEAIDRWSAVSTIDVSALAAVRFEVVDLPGDAPYDLVHVLNHIDIESFVADVLSPLKAVRGGLEG